MSRADRIQELKCFSGGSALVISLDALNWHSKRRCSDKKLKKRDEELQLRLSSGQIIQADEEPQPIVDRRGNPVFQLWRNTDVVTRSPHLSLSPQPVCLLEEPVQHSPFTFLDSFVTDSPMEAPWTRHFLNMQDSFSLITKDFNMVTRQDTVTMDQHDFIIFCDICYIQDCRSFIGNTGCHVSDNYNVSSDMKNSNTHSPCDPNSSNFVDDHSETVNKDRFSVGNVKSLLKACQNCSHPGVLPRRNRNEKLKKTVSFDDDVMVYLFDQESPTSELPSELPAELHTSLPSSCSCSLPDVTLEDNGLEWEDDFSALELNCHFQCVRHSQHYTFPLPTQSWTPLSQSCLFLTHVTDSDLES
uniref:uncharacterized protein LOC109969174 isoform X2 n=1 Tax=Monopterus albus TaxID=43700 RepID=UPI0009B2EC9F|nr:uncharacterized protein LOC109969174 isoform X2 [Monopterus albus]